MVLVTEYSHTDIPSRPALSKVDELNDTIFVTILSLLVVKAVTCTEYTEFLVYNGSSM